MKNYIPLIIAIIFQSLYGCNSSDSNSNTTNNNGDGATNAAPMFTSSTTYTVAENSTTVTTIIATDADGDPVTFSLTGSVDDPLFKLDANSGTLSFKSAPDFESPSDSNTDNVYSIQVTASDGSLSTNQTINITVSDSSLMLNVVSGGIKTLSFYWNAYTDASYYKLLVNQDGASGYTQQGSDISGTSVDVIVPTHLTDWINASYLLEAYDSSNNKLATSDVSTITSLMLSTIGYFKASNTDGFDQFGFSLALSDDGNTLAIGAIGENSATTGVNSTPSGAVYLFRFNGSIWTEQAYIKASNAGSADRFGASVVLSGDGNTLAVGADGEASSTTGVNPTPDDTAGLSGAVYVFRFDGSDWAEQAFIKASNTGASDQFGVSIALSSDGNTLTVGAYSEDSSTAGINPTPDDSASRSGAAYVFRFDGVNWAEQAFIKASNTGVDDFFGYSIALSGDGNTLAVGAWGEASATSGVNSTPDDSASRSGAAYVFRFDGVNWAEQAYIKASNTGSSDQFGYSIALSGDGNTLAVGADFEDSLYPEATPPYPDNAALDSGAAYMFRFDGSNWAEQAFIKASNIGAGDLFGYSIALSGDGNTLAVGARREGSSTTGVNPTPDNSANFSGAAYVFRFDGSNWAEQAFIKASNTGASDYFGSAISLSDNSNTLAVGADYEESSTSGINSTPNDGASRAGAAYLY